MAGTAAAPNQVLDTVIRLTQAGMGPVVLGTTAWTHCDIKNTITALDTKLSNQIGALEARMKTIEKLLGVEVVATKLNNLASAVSKE